MQSARIPIHRSSGEKTNLGFGQTDALRDNQYTTPDMRNAWMRNDAARFPDGLAKRTALEPVLRTG